MHHHLKRALVQDLTAKEEEDVILFLISYWLVVLVSGVSIFNAFCINRLIWTEIPCIA